MFEHSGTVVRFFEDRGFGFVRFDDPLACAYDEKFEPTDFQREAFFHIKGHINPETWNKEHTERMPKRGDRIGFNTRWNERKDNDEVRSWAFDEEINPPPPPVDTRTKVIVHRLPSLNRHTVEPTDVSVASFDRPGGHNYVAWVEVLFRPRTGEYFQTSCSDGTNHGWQPDIKSAKPAEDVVILDD